MGQDPQDRHVFWLNGLAGTGKSTIAQTFSEMVAKTGILGASFFCSRDYLDRRELKNIFPTLAYQLACRYPAFRRHIIRVIKQDPTVASNSLISQLEDLIVGPLVIFKHFVRHRRGRPGRVYRRSTRLGHPLRPRSSRQAAAICQVLHHRKARTPHSDRISPPPPRTVDSDLLAARGQTIQRRRGHPIVPTGEADCGFKTKERPRSLRPMALWRGPDNSHEEVIWTLHLRIHAGQVHRIGTSRAKRTSPTHHYPVGQHCHEGRAGIDPLYTQILVHAFSDVKDTTLFPNLRRVLGAVVVAFNPLVPGADRRNTWRQHIPHHKIPPTSPLGSSRPEGGFKGNPGFPQIIPRLPARP
jgi:hypothetical protein